MSDNRSPVIPAIPVSRIQQIYYIVKMVEALIAVAGAALVGASLATQTPVEGYSIIIVLVVLLVLIGLSFAASEKRYRNPWLDYSSFLLKKEEVWFKSRGAWMLQEAIDFVMW